MLIGRFHPSCVQFFHVVEVDKRAQNRLYCRTSPFGKESRVVFVAVQLFVHLVIKGFVDAVVQLFKFGDFATTFGSKWAVFAVCFTASVDFLGVALAVCRFFFEG